MARQILGNLLSQNVYLIVQSLQFLVRVLILAPQRFQLGYLFFDLFQFLLGLCRCFPSV